MRHSRVHVGLDDLGFTQAVTVVERLRTYDGHPFALPRHLERFATTIAGLQIAGIPSAPRLSEIVTSLLARNRDWLQKMGEASIILLATPGSRHRPALPAASASEAAPPGPTWIAYLQPLPLEKIAARIAEGQPVVVTDVVQPPPESWPRHWKVRNRLHYFLADRQAASQAPDATGILRDTDGTLTESSIANLALVLGGRIVSPPPARVLPGITQAVAEEVAREAGIVWEKRPLPSELLDEAEEVLLFGTTTGIWPGRVTRHAAARNDPTSRPAPSSLALPGPVFRRLREGFDARCRRGSAR